jgi:lysophospholipase L1-like esterase
MASRIGWWVVIGLICTMSAAAQAEDLPGLAGAKRVVFLGDSITYSGQYIDLLDAYLACRFPESPHELINLGLASETVSGLSEPGHAGGQFPRPDLHERLARVLAKTKPDLVVACYGMNCGIYHPLSPDRFERFQAGMTRLHDEVERSGARVIHITPPTFDPQPIKERTLPAGLVEYRQPYVGYNEVLDHYSEWLLAQREKGWQVIDVHGPMNKLLAIERKSKPDFQLAGDGVHMNATGHWLAAQQILLAWGAPVSEIADVKSAEDLLKRFPNGEAVGKLCQQRQRLLRDAWLSEVGHKRPGVKAGLPMVDAQRQSDELSKQIQSLTRR